MSKKKNYIDGAGGGGGGAHTPVDAAVTLRTKTTARVMLLLSTGEIKGIADQTNKLKSVYFNNTPVQNADGTLNFNQVKIDERYGTPTQTIISGFPSSSVTYNIVTKITTTTPVVYTSTTSDVDAIRVTIRFPALFQQESNGDTNGTSVNFKISSRLGSGAYTVIKNITKTDKANTAADQDYLIDRPNIGGSGIWSVKVERVTADNASLNKANDIYFQFATELKNAQKAYPNRALIGLTVSSDTTGSQYPTFSADVYGMLIKVPSNYTVATRIYSGTWDGTFKATKEWCDNPVWVLYDMLTGSGDHSLGINPAYIDQYSFYDAAVYCDQPVPSGAQDGHNEPRYTFNYQFMEQASAWEMVQNVAATCGSVIYTSGNRVRLVQDRPTAATRLMTNSNVEDGMFEYTSTQKEERITACTVYWNNPAENYLSVPEYYEDTAKVNAAGYGYNLKEVTGLGITSQGQAYRLARWVVDTSLNTTKSVSFKVGFMNAGLEPGEVIKVMDTVYAQVEQEARILSKTSSSITLDRSIAVSNGNTFDVIGSDGITLETRTITSTGTLSTINFTGAALTALTGSTCVVTGSVSPRTFKVTNVKEDSPGIYSVSAVQYDPAKFGRVDGTFTLPTPTYQAPKSLTVVPPVTNITFSQESYTDVDNNAKRYLVVKWTPPTNTYIVSYQMLWSKDNGDVFDVGVLTQPSAKFLVDSDGTYSVIVYAINANNVSSPGATASYNLSLAAPIDASSLLPVTGLQVVGGGSTFTSETLNVVWTDPNTNTGAVVKNYLVSVKDAATPSTVYRTEEVIDAAYTYDLVKQSADNPSGPKRSVIISVQVRDTFGRLSTATAVTFSNPAPGTVSGLVTTSAVGTIFLNWADNTEIDLVGYIVWRGTSAGFTPSTSNKIWRGTATSMSDPTVVDGVNYYYKIAAYDSFGGNDSGTGLNITTSGAATSTPAANTNEYQLTGVVYTPNSPSANSVAWSAGTAYKRNGTGAGATWSITAGNAAWTSGVMYIYYTEGETILRTTTTITAAIANNKIIVATYRGGTQIEIGNGKAYLDGGFIIAGTIGASQLVVGTAVITQSAQIAALVVTDAQIANLNGSKIVANSITADKIDTRNLTIKDSAGNIIFSAGTNLDSSRVNASPGWQNSNITVDSNGNLNGIGTGSGTTVSNSSISVDSTGKITGIGTGNSTVVANNKITISSNGALSGAGGGQATLSGMGAGNFATVNTITASNVSTLIASAAIGRAYIGALNVANADIIDATIDTLKLKNGSVTDIKTVTAQAQQPTINFGGLSAGNQFRETTWTMTTPSWTTVSPIGVTGPFPVNVFASIQAPVLQWLGTLISVTVTTRLQKFNGSSWVNIDVRNSAAVTVSPSGTTGGFVGGTEFRTYQFYTTATPGDQFRLTSDYDVMQTWMQNASASTSTSNYLSNSAVSITQLK